MRPDYGKHDLVDYLSMNPDKLLSMEEVLAFLTHAHINGKYRAIQTMVMNGTLTRVMVRGQQFFKLNRATHLILPDIRWDETTPRHNLEWRFQRLLAAHIKCLVQHRMDAARFRYVDIERYIVTDWKPIADLINFLNDLLTADISAAGALQLEEELMKKLPTYNPDKDPYDLLGIVIDDLNVLDIRHEFNDEQRESIQDYNDRRNVYDIGGGLMPE